MKSNAFSELSNKNWLWDSMLNVDIHHKNVRLERKHKFVYTYVKAFKSDLVGLSLKISNTSLIHSFCHINKTEGVWLICTKIKQIQVI